MGNTVSEAVETRRARIARRQVDKFGERRAELAAAALHTLAELGFARTSLREIAQNSEFSHGVLHYYFSDKADLLTEAVRQFEEICVTRYDELVAAATSADGLRTGFADAMAATLAADARVHRLWYDLRNQSLFDDSFRKDVLELDERRTDMIWRVVDRYAELAGATVTVAPRIAYAMLDGIFEQALLRHLCDDDNAVRDLPAVVANVLTAIIAKA
ncbi:TetR/AcrR family transcriptional regulator [Actinophytocola algeriensis]|uniref:TetR/AcrR family transcriptional regulator n=1 Tax=Actinophytocola algeriensis TaxID=1768010 RepID=UPI00160EF316